MKSVPYWAIFLSIILMGVGCERLKIYPSPTPTNTPFPVSELANHSQKPDIRGNIVDIFEEKGQTNAIQVEGVLESDTKYDRASVQITNRTRIYLSNGNDSQVASLDQLTIGLRVEVLFTGMILERYPVSAEATEILIVPFTPFPTLTIVPGPSPTLVPILEPAKDAAGTIYFVAQKGKDAKSNVYSVNVDATGKITNPSTKLSDDEVLSDSFIFSSPDGKYFAITGAWGALNIFNTESGILENSSLNLGAEGVFFNWFPDNRQILWGGGALVLSDPLNGAQTTLVVPGYGGITGAAASPDGQYVVYAYSNNTVYEPGLWIINSNGQNPHLLSRGVSPTNFAWSPDGKRIAFFGLGWQVIDADGINLREVAAGITLPQCYFLPPLWSPDSRSLAVVTSETGDSFCRGWTDDNFKGTNIVLIDVNSGKARLLLSDGSSGNIDPTWSPDGSQIAFVSNRSGIPEIWIVNTDGSNLRQLTFDDNLVHFPKWLKP